jgi:hypothetical protein
MSSPASVLANRRNARASTGPSTPAGTARASRNARRHGFTLPVLADPALAPEVAGLAREIERSVTGRPGDAARHALACRIAEAIIDLRRIRIAKLPLVAALHADPAGARTLRELARLDRYERHALWRRKRAIGDFATGLARQNEARNPNDSNIAADPSTTNGKSCAAPRDRIGSPPDRSPTPPDPSSEQTPHGEVET